MVLIVGLSISRGDAPASSVTYGSTALTKIGEIGTSSVAPRVEMWALVSPTSGTATITVSRPSGSGSIVGGSVSLLGVSSVGTPVVASGTTATGLLFQPTVSGLPTTAGTVLVDTLAADFNGLGSAGPSQSVQWDTVGGGTVNGAGSTADATQTGGTMSWQVGTILSIIGWAMGAVPLSPVC